MTAKDLYKELDAFLGSDTPQVLCISGKWGVGKTHAWNEALKRCRSNGTLGNAPYAYVSLFGQRSLDDLRYAIFENTVPASGAGLEADLTTVKSSLDAITKGWRRGIGMAGVIPQTSSYFAGLTKLGFLTIRNQIVCIDDLERAGDGLPTKDVLGIISYLKERRGCRVVLLLNDEALSGQNKVDYAAQLEKVADVVFKFQPTPAEAAEIGLDHQAICYDQLKADAVKLGITNIRVLNKIEGYARKLSPLLEHYDNRVLTSALHSVSLFAFSKFQPGAAPSIEFIKSNNGYDAYMAAQKPESDPNAEWRSLLNEYNFSHLDELDIVVLEGVESGYFQSERLNQAAKIIHDRLGLADQDNRFTQAWSAYHDTFDNNEDEIVSQLQEAVASCAPAISPMNLSGTVGLFKELGRDREVPALIASYIAGRSDGPDFWNLDEYSFGSEVKDPDVQTAFAARYAEMSPTLDPLAMIIELGTTRGWNPGDVAIASRIGEDQLYAAFKSLKGLDLRRAVLGATKFKNIRSDDADMARLSATAHAVLKKIAGESRVNSRRVEKYI